MAARSSEWISLKRSLFILRRLVIGPASGQELIQAVVDNMGAEAYPLGEKARRAAFKHDRDNLRKNLDVDFAYNVRLGLYALKNLGPVATLELSPDHLRTLAMLYQVVSKRGDEIRQVRDLINELMARLSPDDQRKITTYSLAIDIRLEHFIGDGVVENKVWSTAERAIQEKRKLAFNYLPEPPAELGFWYIEVAPLKIQFRNGGWHLQAYEHLNRKPNSSDIFNTGYRRYQLTRIQNDDKLAVLPNIVSHGLNKPPNLPVHYRLLPSIPDDAVRQYFDKMQVTRLSDSGYEVTGVTDDIKEAARLLASYGEDCIVLGGPDLLSAFEEMLRKMAGNYDLIP